MVTSSDGRRMVQVGLLKTSLGVQCPVLGLRRNGRHTTSWQLDVQPVTRYSRSTRQQFPASHGAQPSTHGCGPIVGFYSIGYGLGEFADSLVLAVERPAAVLVLDGLPRS